MVTISTNNNLLEIIYELFANDIIEQDKLDSFFQVHPFFSHEISVKDQINLKLFLIQLLIEEKNFLWETYQKVARIRNLIIPMNQANGRKLEVLVTYLSNILQYLNQFVVYNGYLKITEAMTTNFPQKTRIQHQFFLDTSSLPIESLCGYYSYLNPILRSVFESQSQDINFLLHDAMCEECCNAKDEIKGNFLRIKKNMNITRLNEIKHSLWKLLDQDFCYSQLYYENYYNICRILSKKDNTNYCDIKKRNRKLTISDYEYFYSLID